MSQWCGLSSGKLRDFAYVQNESSSSTLVLSTTGKSGGCFFIMSKRTNEISIETPKLGWRNAAWIPFTYINSIQRIFSISLSRRGMNMRYAASSKKTASSMVSFSCIFRMGRSFGLKLSQWYRFKSAKLCNVVIRWDLPNEIFPSSLTQESSRGKGANLFGIGWIFNISFSTKTNPSYS